MARNRKIQYSIFIRKIQYLYEKKKNIRTTCGACIKLIYWVKILRKHLSMLLTDTVGYLRKSSSEHHLIIVINKHWIGYSSWYSRVSIFEPLIRGTEIGLKIASKFATFTITGKSTGSENRDSIRDKQWMLIKTRWNSKLHWLTMLAPLY